MKVSAQVLGLTSVLILVMALGVAVGETPLSLAQYARGFRPHDPIADVLWNIRAHTIEIVRFVEGHDRDAVGLQPPHGRQLALKPLNSPSSKVRDSTSGSLQGA